MTFEDSRNLIRALRLPFLTASVFPFILGSLISRHNFNALNFMLGLISAMATHLSANLINDYADSKSGADWRDMNFYRFFGGSKLIQEGVFSEKFYFRLSARLALVSLACVIVLTLRLNSFLVIGFYAAIICLAWLYSVKPLQFSYRRAGEIVIFLLFGPALVMGGHFIQTKIFPAFNSFLLSLPFGFLTTAILFSNEVPDCADDARGNKLTWVSLTGAKWAYILYLLLIFLAFLSIGLAIVFKIASPVAGIAFIFIPLALKAAKILRIDFNDKVKLMESSKLTIAVHSLVSLSLIAGVIF